MKLKCPDCDGTGKKRYAKRFTEEGIEYTCPFCHGTGFNQEAREAVEAILASQVYGREQWVVRTADQILQLLKGDER